MSDQLVAEIPIQQTQEKNMHAFRGIRRRDPNNRAAVDLLLRQHGQRDRRQNVLQNYNIFSCKYSKSQC
jgi:hypothetical protein